MPVMYQNSIHVSIKYVLYLIIGCAFSLTNYEELLSVMQKKMVLSCLAEYSYSKPPRGVSRNSNEDRKKLAD